MGFYLFCINYFFFFPLLMIVLIYIRIVKYMKQNLFSTVNRSDLAAQRRQQSELRLVYLQPMM